MNDSNNQSTTFDTDTPIRLPKTSLLSDKDLIKINLSQEEDISNEIFWSDSEVSKKKEVASANSKETQEKENTQKMSQKKRKRLMKYDSDELLMAKKDKREALPGNQQKLSMLLNPVKIKATRSRANN